MGRATGIGAAAFAAAAALALMTPGTAHADSIVVTPATPGQMVANLVGGGITASNVTYTGAASASGTFSGNGNVLPFNSGIVLTTGAASFVTGPNTTPSFTVDNLAAGDAQLTAAVGAQTYNASALEFDFTSSNAKMSFQFVFGSEEYKEFVGSGFNDAFAFYLNGQNIALIPGTTTPIAINNVNQVSNSSYFTDNTAGTYDTQLDGLVGASTSLFAAGDILPGTNHIKIVIADTNDRQYDSAVFLKAGSFIDQPPPVVPLPGAALAGMALFSSIGLGKLRRRMTSKPSA